MPDLSNCSNEVNVMPEVSKDMEELVRSPCVSICALDHADICIGCHRHADEIASWSLLTNEQKRDVLRRVAERERKAPGARP